MARDPDRRTADAIPGTDADHAMSRHLRGILAVFAVVMLIGGTDMTKVTVALPVIADELGMGSMQSLWTADIYALAAGVVLVPAAVAADRFGRRRTYLLGLTVATASATLAAVAHTPQTLILARIGQGVGSAMLIAGTVAIIRVCFPGSHRRAIAYGVWTAGFSAGSALGPLLGGGLVELAGWQWVFWINVPVLTICLIAAWMILEESKNPDPPALDAPSVAYSAAAVGLLIAGLKGLAQPESGQWLSLASVAAGATAALLFVLRQRNLPRPFLDVGLFSNRLLAVCAAVIAATNGAFNGVLYLLTQHFQVIDGLSVVQAGIALIPMAAASALGGITGPLLHRGLTQQRIITAGLAQVAAGLALLTPDEGLAELVGMIILGHGAGIIMAIGANAIMSSAPPDRTADAGAIQESAFAIGAGSGIATLGALAIYHGTNTPGGPTVTTIYGPGADDALVLVALLYGLFALTAGLLILTTPAQRRRQADRHRARHARP